MKVKFTTMIDEELLSAIKIQAIKEKRNHLPKTNHRLTS